MDINKIFDGSLDEIANNIFNETKNTTDKAKAIQQQKIAENVQYVIDALKKIETDLRGEYSDVADKLSERILSIKDGKDGRNGADGRDGKDGRPGRDGLVGAKGADGFPGRDGIDGVDGVSVTDASIDFDGSLIINLSNGRVINVGEVVSQDLADKIQVISTMSTNGAVGIQDEGTTISSGVKNINFVGASVTSTASGDNVTVNIGAAGTGVFDAGTALLPSITTTGDLNTGIYFPAADTVGITTGGSERMRVDSAGRLLSNQTASYLTQVGNSSGWAPNLQVSQTSVSNIGLGVYSWSGYSAADIGGGIGLADFVISHSNNNTPGSHTAVSNGMVLGRISLSGSDGTNFVCGAFISGAADGQTWASGDCPGRLVFGTTADGTAVPTERMRIDSSGNVGIGTASPNTALTLGTTNPVLSFYQPDSTYSLSRSSTEMILNSASSTRVTSDVATVMEVRNGYLQFKTGAGAGTTERMRISSSGNVGIGATVPGAKLEINTGTTTTVGQIIQMVASQTADVLRVTRSDANLSLQFTPSGQLSIGDFAASAATVITTGPSTSTNANLKVSGNNVGNPNIFIQSYQGGGGAIGGPTSFVYFGDNNRALSYIGGTKVNTFAANASSDLVFGTTPDISATAVTERMRISSSGIVLIGTASASGSNLLQVNSDALVNTLTVGRGPGNKQDNAVLGYQALNNGGANVGSSVAIGYQALFTATAANADRQVAIGYQALYSNNDTTGAVNIGIGYLAGKAATGKSNLFIGGYCSYLRTTGDYNTFVGGSSGTNFSSVPTGSSNTALGASSLGSLTTGYANVSIGYATGTLLATGACNVFVGEVAGYNATGSRNVFVGGGNTAGLYSAGQLQTTGDANTYIGSAAGGLMTTGSYNVILGGYTGNSGGLDMRALNNYIVLSDGQANIRQVIDSSGNVLIGKVSATANGGDLQVSKGITFPATQVAASDPNTLDDYEEGTWTPSLQFSGAAVGMTYTTRTGKYTKVGNLVTINCRIELSAKGSSTGVARIESLPFAASSSQFLPPPFVTGLVTATSVGMNVTASTSIDLLNAQWNYGAALTDANLSNTSRIEFTVSYLV